MKKVAAVTFHSSYNFGSNLQAYALQEYIKKIAKGEIEYNIINLRTQVQKNMYDYKKNKGIKRFIKSILYGKKFDERQKKFEKFINEYLDITKEYNSNDELEKEDFEYEYYISGSDQIWNWVTQDFNWAYFLDFVKKGKKASYAVSMGPVNREIDKEDKEKMKYLLNQYDYISVREEGTQKKVKELTNMESHINIDPTMLLKKEEWNKIINNNKIYSKPYILFYTLKPSKVRSILVKKIAKKLNRDVVVANPSYIYDIIGSFKRKYESGPIEFLNLINNADLVISSSFHGTVFSILFNKPFFALNGKNDFRIYDLLRKTNLQDRAIVENDNIEEIAKKAYEIDFKNVNEVLELEREKSKKYLIKFLEIEE